MEKNLTPQEIGPRGFSPERPKEQGLVTFDSGDQTTHEILATPDEVARTLKATESVQPGAPSIVTTEIPKTPAIFDPENITTDLASVERADALTKQIQDAQEQPPLE